MDNNNTEVVIVSGMSGAGRTEAIHVFEDLGYYCVDNLPPSLVTSLVSIAHLKGSTGDTQKIAIVCDARMRDFFTSLSSTIEELKEKQIETKILFLDAEDDKLIARYKSSRRRHPLCDDGASIALGIERERSLLREIKQNADHVIDTTNLLPSELKRKINAFFSTAKTEPGMTISVYSFGFKHGSPIDADIVIDVRFLPNPYYDPIMRTMTGLDDEVREYVLYNSETDAFLKKWYALLDCVMPGYVAEGKQQLAIAVGCTGGQHRSVVLAEATGDYLRSAGYRASVAHRDLSLALKKNGKNIF